MYTTLIKNKNRTIISTDAEKALNKTQHAYIIKPLQKVVTGETYLNLMKATYNKHTANTILSGQRLNTFPLRLGTRQECTIITFIQHIYEVLAMTITEEEEIKGIQTVKRRSKTITVC